MANELTWHDVLAEEKQQPYFLNTLQTVASERQSGVTIYPPQKMSLTRSALRSWVTLKW
ncbi:hypothetical protein MUTS15_53120 [Escherichia coli]|nr:hypothetical protein MUTS15_53120 [Escherichia coli]BDZ05205.1 hypothetical protein MUTS16_62780 [Escherichia coli]